MQLSFRNTSIGGRVLFLEKCLKLVTMYDTFSCKSVDKEMVPRGNVGWNEQEGNHTTQ